MNKYMFALFDNKAALWSNPFVSIRREAALRDLLRAAQSPESEIYHSPADYDMYCLGEYEDETGILTVYPQKEFITNCYVLRLQADGEQE